MCVKITCLLKFELIAAAVARIKLYFSSPLITSKSYYDAASYSSFNLLSYLHINSHYLNSKRTYHFKANLNGKKLTRGDVGL